MKCITYLLIVLLGVSNVHAQQISSTISNKSEGEFSFFIRSAHTGYGLQTTVTLVGNDTNYTLASNNGGFLHFKNKVGLYTITFNSNNHNELSTYFYIEPNTTVEAEINLDQSIITPIITVTSTPSLQGYVIDGSTGKPIANIDIVLSNKVKTTTNNEGYYSVILQSNSTKQDGKAERIGVKFSAQGYTTHSVNGIVVAPTTIKVNVVLYKGNALTEVKDFQHILDGTQADVDAYENSTPAVNSNFKNINNNTITSSGGCIVPKSIRVGTNCNCTKCTRVTVMSLQHYTETGIDNEWMPTWQYHALAAGSVAYRTYGAWYVNNPVKKNYDIASTTCNQTWSATTYANAQAAALATTGMILTVNGSTPARAEYSAENNGQGAAGGSSCGNCNSGTGSGYPCNVDNVCCGQKRFGHGRGMCQWGTQRWALSGKNYSWIIAHYYTIGGLSVCGNNTASCGITANINANNITANSLLLSWFAVSGAISYVIEYKENNSANWISTTAATNSKSITGLLPGKLYNYKIQAICSVSGIFSTVANFSTLIINDDCATAQQIIPNTTCTFTNASLVNATSSGVPKSGCDVANSSTLKDVWFVFTATNTHHSITVQPSTGIDAVVSIYNSCNGSEINCADSGGGQGGTETINDTNFSIGTNYYVRVYSYGSAIPTTKVFNICVKKYVTNLRLLASNIINTNADFSIYPNPNTGIFFINNSDIINSITITNLFGQVVYNNNYPTTNAIIDISTAPKGTYLVRIINANETITKSIIIE